MTIKHHLTEQLLLSYSAGELPEAFSLVVATHLSMCDECRARAESFDAVGGSIIENTYSDMAAGSLDACFARIGGLQPAEPVLRPRRGIFPAPLAEYVGGGLSDVKWRPLGLGAKQAILKTSDAGATVRLLAIPGGAAMPEHSHRGLELTLVLQGAFRDEDDRFAAGDVEVADASLEHTPIAEMGQVCICLAATEGRLKFNSLIPRLAQPFFRI